MNNVWEKFNRISLTDLIKSRKQLHQAVQLPAIASRAFHPKVTDDHFASLRWDSNLNGLKSQSWGKGYKTKINFNDFSLGLINNENEIIDNFTLDSNTYKDGFEKLKEMAVVAGEDPALLTTDLPYEIPVYPIAKGEAFQLFNKDFFEELSKYFSNANLVLKDIVKNNSEASEIACWPHHFDIATLLVLDGSSDNYKSVGVGLSPGDDNYNQPYFYITPWPYPKTEDLILPELPSGGFWHTAGWVGAILTAENILDFDSSTTQLAATIEFVNFAINECKRFLNL